MSTYFSRCHNSVNCNTDRIETFSDKQSTPHVESIEFNLHARKFRKYILISEYFCTSWARCKVTSMLSNKNCGTYNSANVCVMLPVADPGFSRGGGVNPSRGGVNTPNFPENCMKSKEFGRPGGACVPHAPPRSANGCCCQKW